MIAGAWACSPSDAPAENATTCGGTELIAAASDYASTVVCGAPPCAATSSPDLGKDPQLVTTNGRVFFLGRPNDLVFELDPACGTPLRGDASRPTRFSVHQDDVRTGQPANPHDLAAARDGSLFVVLYNVPRIVVMKEGKQDGPPIDLSGYDELDQNPQADAIRIVSVGGAEKAFVTLERLDDKDTVNILSSKRPSEMLRIDVATRQVEAVIELAGRNPFNTMAEHDGALFLAEPGNFDADDEERAGIERFDSATSTTRLLVAERDLGGSVTEIAVTDGCGVAIVAGKQKNVNPTSVVTFDPVSGRVLSAASAPLLASAGFELSGLAWRHDTLYVGDRRAASVGYDVHVFSRDPGTCNLHETGRTIKLPQRPVALRATH